MTKHYLNNATNTAGTFKEIVKPAPPKSKNLKCPNECLSIARLDYV